ncbi:hypothetical protein [Streptomyces flaveolus]
MPAAGFTDLGERMILAPVALNSDLDDETVRVLACQLGSAAARRRAIRAA